MAEVKEAADGVKKAAESAGKEAKTGAEEAARKPKKPKEKKNPFEDRQFFKGDSREDNTAGDINRTAAKTEKFVKSAVAAGKAVGKAYSGNYGGAAKEVLKDEGLRKIVAVAIALGFAVIALILIVLFYVVPSSVSSLTGSISMDMADVNVRALTDTDGIIDSFEESFTCCANAFYARQEDICSRINASSEGSTDSDDNINGWIYKNLFIKRDKGRYANIYTDAHSIRYGGVELYLSREDADINTSLELMALFSAMYKTQDTAVSSGKFEDWLGRGASGQPEMTFDIDNHVFIAVDGYRGTFMPEYLIYEQTANPDKDYSSHQCAVVDIMTCVSSSDMDTLLPIVDVEEEVIYGEKTSTSWGWSWLTPSQYKARIKGYTVKKPTVPKPADKTTVPWARFDWYWVPTSTTEITEETVRNYIISYEMEITVGIRDISELEDIAGMYDKYAEEA